MRQFVLAVCLALGVAAGSANADILTWTFKGTIYVSEDTFGNVFGEGPGNGLSVGHELTVTFYLDLDKLPPDECINLPLDACWINSLDPANPDNGWGEPGGSWITSEVTVFNGFSTFVIPNTVVGSGSVENLDFVRRGSNNNPDYLIVQDYAKDSFHEHWTRVAFSAYDDLFNDGATTRPAITDPFTVANPSGSVIVIQRRGPDVEGAASALVTFGISSYSVPSFGTLALLALGLVPLSLSRRYRP